MQGMFEDAESFNGDISRWNVFSVTDMNSMFAEATIFNSDISKWTVSAVTDMQGMFFKAAAFSQDLEIWKTKLKAGVNKKVMFTKSGVISLPSWMPNDGDKLSVSK